MRVDRMAAVEKKVLRELDDASCWTECWCSCDDEENSLFCSGDVVEKAETRGADSIR